MYPSQPRYAVSGTKNARNFSFRFSIRAQMRLARVCPPGACKMYYTTFLKECIHLFLKILDLIWLNSSGKGENAIAPLLWICYNV